MVLPPLHVSLNARAKQTVKRSKSLASGSSDFSICWRKAAENTRRSRASDICVKTRLCQGSKPPFARKKNHQPRQRHQRHLRSALQHMSWICKMKHLPFSISNLKSTESTAHSKWPPILVPAQPGMPKVPLRSLTVPRRSVSQVKGRFCHVGLNG